MKGGISEKGDDQNENLVESERFVGGGGVGGGGEDHQSLDSGLVNWIT